MRKLAWLWPICLSLGCVALPQVAAPDPAHAPLKAAAACLERGDDAAAAPHLAKYVEDNPDHAAVRVHYGEVLARLGRSDEARAQFGRYVEDARRQGDAAGKHLVLAHTRLAELAVAAGDEYAEHLHRGVGLLTLANQMLANPGDGDGPDPQALLFKAVAELDAAAEQKPGSARPHWYAYEAWSQLGQQLPARRSLARARAGGPLSDLTPAERAALALAAP